MPTLTITLTDEEYPKLEAEAAKLRRTPEAQAEVLVLEGLKIGLKAPPKEPKEVKAPLTKVAASNGAELA